jgi:indolepyruvate ferredoxin oxidoreductase, alpha subunit
LEEYLNRNDIAGQRHFMLGNEAIARGAIEAGVQVATAYPGTPSSEITETLSRLAESTRMYVEWSVNEKVAFEVALAASICGIRSMVSMKHVGVNVAHDPLMTAGYIGAKGGMVIISADDPNTWSSQVEQDNRYIAEQALIPVLEPSSIQEAKDMIANAFTLSEKFAHLFMLRSVTRIGHSRGDVLMGEINNERRDGSFVKDRSWLVYTPVEARKNRVLMLQRFEKIKQAVNTFTYNQLKIKKNATLGIIASGISYGYAVEAVKWLRLEDEVSILKIGTPYPLPERLVQRLLKSVDQVLIVEELDPFVEIHTKAIASDIGASVKVHGKNLLPRMGELSTNKVVDAIAHLMKVNKPVSLAKIAKLNSEVAAVLPLRPPTLCPGCPHRASQYAIRVAARQVSKKIGQNVEPVFPGDIGCYTLGYNPPLESSDTVIAMGSGFGMANGFAHVLKVPIVTHLGDSTFFHSGIPPLINAVFNNANITMVVLDNSATAMTGFQPNPGTGTNALNKETPKLRMEDIARACNVKFIEVVDPFDLKNTIETFKRAIEFDGPSFVVSRRLCAMIAQRERKKTGEESIRYQVDQRKCNEKCKTCITVLGCPAILLENGKTIIDESSCTGCGLCAQVCPYKAIGEKN